MADLYIRFSVVLCRHRKLAELAKALRVRRSAAAGHLAFLWCASLEQQEDGDLSEWSDEFIAESSDFPADAPQFVRLLQEHGFLDGRIIHDWLDYVGDFLRNRYASSNRDLLVQIWAKHGRTYGERKPDARANPPPRKSDATPTQPLRQEDPTQPSPHGPPRGVGATSRNSRKDAVRKRIEAIP